MKKVLLATVATVILAGATVSAPVPAAAITCEDAAKMKYPDSVIDRMKYKRQCKKAWKDANGKGLLNKLRG